MLFLLKIFSKLFVFWNNLKIFRGKRLPNQAYMRTQALLITLNSSNLASIPKIAKVSKFSRDYMMTALEILYGNCPECGTPQEREVYEEYMKKYRPLMQTSRGKLQTLTEQLHPVPDVKANTSLIIYR